MMRKGIFVLCIMLSVMFVSALSAEQLQLDPKQRFYFLKTNKTSTMQEELEHAAGMGFRIISGAPGGDAMAVLLERVAQPPEVFSYKLLATSKTSTMEKEMNEVATQGYRILPSAVMAKKMMFLDSWEIVLVMERSPKTEQIYQYRLLATSRESTMFKEMEQAMAEEYHCVGILGRGELMILLERQAPAAH